MPTLNEVAQRAGVTPATVSSVLRNKGRVGAATRQRVLDAIAALGYRPHLPARALAEGRAPTIALMVSSIANPFYPEFALAVERALRGSDGDERTRMARDAFTFLHMPAVTGIVLLAVGLRVMLGAAAEHGAWSDVAILRLLKRSAAPTVISQSGSSKCST